MYIKRVRVLFIFHNTELCSCIIQFARAPRKRIGMHAGPLFLSFNFSISCVLKNTSFVYLLCGGEKRKETKMKTDRTGERRQMNNGKYATLIEYKDSRHCLLKFDNGYTTWCKYGNFVDGNVKWHESFIGNKFYNKFGEQCVVNDQTGRKLTVKNTVTKQTFIIDEKEIPKLSKKSSLLGRKYENIDGNAYWITKIYRDRNGRKSLRCDVRFDTGEKRSCDLGNATNKIIRNRPRLTQFLRTAYK